MHRLLQLIKIWLACDHSDMILQQAEDKLREIIREEIQRELRDSSRRD